MNSVCQPHISMIELLSPQQSCIGFVLAKGINRDFDRKGSNAVAVHVVPKTQAPGVAFVDFKKI